MARVKEAGPWQGLSGPPANENSEDKDSYHFMRRWTGSGKANSESGSLS
jgi:hypothetical protein